MKEQTRKYIKSAPILLGAGVAVSLIGINGKPISAATSPQVSTTPIEMPTPAAPNQARYAQTPLDPEGTQNTQAQPVKAGATELKTVVTVNGHRLNKDMTIKNGDQVTWTVLAFPGNEGLLTSLSDTLPAGLSFNKDPLNIYEVANDGTVTPNASADKSAASDVTKDFQLTVAGNTLTAIPASQAIAEKYFYTGAGHPSRLAFSISTTAATDINYDTIFRNGSQLTVTNPRQPQIPITANSVAQVHTPISVGSNVTKTVKADNGHSLDPKPGQTQLTLSDHGQKYDYVLNALITPGAVKKSLVINDPLENVQKASIDANNVKVFSATGQDITSSFDISLTNVPAGSANPGFYTGSYGNTVSADKNALKETKNQINTTNGKVNVKLTAKADLVKTLSNIRDNTRYTVVIGRVSINGATNDQQKPFLDSTGSIHVPNMAQLVLDGTPLNSLKTVVNYTPPKAVSPTHPNKPVQKPLNTGLKLFGGYPLLALLASIAVGGGIGEYAHKLHTSKKDKQ